MRTSLAPVIVAVLALALSGCTPQPEAPGSATASPTPTTSMTASPSADPSAEPPASLPVPSCAELVSADQLYEYNPNVSAKPDFRPDRGSLTARVAAAGVACGYVNLSSNEVISLAVGAPDAAELSDLTAELSGLGAARWNGTDGYFGQSDGQYTAAAVVDGYVIVSSSTAYLEAADAAPIVDAALSAV